MKRITVFTAVFLFWTAAMAQKPDISWYVSNYEADTFRIANADQLAGLGTLVINTAGLGQAVNFKGKTIVLTNNIDLSKYGINYNAKKGWIPIGEAMPFVGTSNMFYGVFDGNGKTISGLYINDQNQTIGLFKYVAKPGEIKNLGLVNVNITGGDHHIGAIVGSFGGNLVANCYSTGTIRSTSNGSVGGIAGRSDGKVVDCYSSSIVKGDNGRGTVGGVVGVFSGSLLTGCYSTGTISGGTVGGIVGSSTGKIANSYFTGAVSGGNVGGVVGHGRGEIANCYSTSVVSGNYGVGGVVGSMDGYGSVSVTNCYSTGTVSGNNYVGGVIGGGQYGYITVSNCAALNPSIKAKGSDFGRIWGGTGGGKFSANVAFVGATNNIGNSMWINKTAEEKNGADIPASEIKADPTIGGRFTVPNGWVTEAGKLPGLGATVNMPAHLK